MTPDLGKLKQLAEEEAAQATPGRWKFNVNPATVLALIARIEALEAGLRPFAELVAEGGGEPDGSDSIWPSDPDHWTAHEFGWGRRITIANIRRAANLLGDRLCEDEGCPHYGTPHVCLSLGDRHD